MESFLNNVGLNLNPFSTAVGQKIEEATDSNSETEDWQRIMEVCDMINETEDGPRDAVKAIKKRLQQNAGKSYKTVSYTLTLLEACVKNCNRRFHVLVCSKDFVQELVKLISKHEGRQASERFTGPKHDPPTEIQDKVLSLIQSWADAFVDQPEMSAVVQIYNDLKANHIEFPMTDLDSMAPIHTPRKTVSASQASTRYQANASPLHPPQTQTKQPTQPHPQPQPQPQPNPNSDRALRLSPEQLAKLYSELDIVQENMTILNEMLSELIPGKEHPSDLELLTQLYNTCKAMQERLVELISQLANDEVTAELLRINDLLNNLFLRYSRYEKNKTATETSKAGFENKADLLSFDGDHNRTQNMNFKQELDLISDFTALDVRDSGSATAGSTLTPKKVNVEKDKDAAEFDMFAQSRNVTYETSKKGGSSYEDNLKPNHIAGGLAAATQNRSQPPSLMHRESDFDEMAAWLGEQTAVTETDSLTSSEFDRFLAERAAAAENLPSSQATASPSRNTVSQRNPKQSSNKDMYAL